MSRFIEESLRKAGLLVVLDARRSGDLAGIAATSPSWSKADLLGLGAVADAVRVDDVGEVVHIHERAPRPGDPEVTWVDPIGASELDFLRAVAVARISARKGARIGVDWSQRGMELAQVALGFGASDLRGPITRKSGLPILADERLKVKGQGMVDLRAIKRREIAALVTYAGRLPVFVEAARDANANDDTPRARESSKEVANV
jgi:hypothetical protein